eukprot:TRINITY_DN444_c0_g1_i1.p1 TRINITY_DN444_c0_g1~~TRINITY_DN444_c0_g1_i1.p1  ORF type:complete len:239 (+),score=37.84 TRINITY_DN444_c0_g1_i1:268-984(+)
MIFSWDIMRMWMGMLIVLEVVKRHESQVGENGIELEVVDKEADSDGGNGIVLEAVNRDEGCRNDLLYDTGHESVCSLILELVRKNRHMPHNLENLMHDFGPCTVSEFLSIVQTMPWLLERTQLNECSIGILTDCLAPFLQSSQVDYPVLFSNECALSDGKIILKGTQLSMLDRQIQIEDQNRNIVGTGTLSDTIFIDGLEEVTITTSPLNIPPDYKENQHYLILSMDEKSIAFPVILP